eukprot:Clim_evm23s196 gene=Clim_evmTU23s196
MATQGETWSKVHQMPAVRELYGYSFPIELRHYFAEWFEKQNWESIKAGSDDGQQQAATKVRELFEEVHKYLQQISSQPGDSFLLRLRLEEIATSYRQMCENDPMGFVQVVSNALKREKEILEKGAPTVTSAQHVLTADHEKIMYEIEATKGRARDADNDIKQLRQLQEDVIFQYQEAAKYQQILQQMSEKEANYKQLQQNYQQLEKSVSQKAKNCLQFRHTLLGKLEENIQLITRLQRHVVVNKTIQFREKVRLGTLTQEQSNEVLATYQTWFEKLAEIVFSTKNQTRHVQMLMQQLPMSQSEDRILVMRKLILDVLIELIQRAFLIDQQPPQVLKTQTKFQSSCRFLISQVLNVPVNPPEVTATVVNEYQAAAIFSEIGHMPEGFDGSNLDVQLPASLRTSDLASASTRNIAAAVAANGPRSKRSRAGDRIATGAGTGHYGENLPNCGDILNNTSVMDYSESDQILRAYFKNMSLRKIRRGDLKSDETVTEEKFAMCFCMSISIPNDITLTLYALSLPIVVIVHGNQLPNAEATVLWDNHFSVDPRVPWKVPDSVAWNDLAAALSKHFARINGGEIEPDGLNYLGQKVGVGSDYICTWHKFNKEPLQNRNFTFWEWFYGIEEVVKRHLVATWKAGLIVGFIGKQHAQDLLLQCQPGTFILRFSDSEIGGMSVAWVSQNEDGQKQVWHLQPWFSKDLAIRGLADRVHDLPQLRTLYPNRDKDEAFGPYYSTDGDNKEQEKNSYVRTGITTVIPNAVNQITADLGDMTFGTPASVAPGENEKSAPRNVEENDYTHLDLDDILNQINNNNHPFANAMATSESSAPNANANGGEVKTEEAS